MPNWYHVLKEAGFKDKLKEIARPAVMMAPLGLLGLMSDSKTHPPQPPISMERQQPTLTTQPTTRPLNVSPTSAPSTQSSQPDSTGAIDVKKIIQMESSGRPQAESPTGAAGLMQVMPATWEDIASKIGQYSGFDKWKFDEKANITIGSYYMNTEIPRLLKSSGIPDTIDTRLAAYNFGVGNLKKLFQKHGKEWKSNLPTETANYLKKYHR
jgi:soluble lytic murein transglycosylase-like protein